MQQRHGSGLTGVLGVLGTGLLCAALAGCGSVVASGTAAAPAAPAATTAAPAPGCGAVNQATKVIVRRVLRVTLPVSERAWLERLLLRAGPAARVVDGDHGTGPAAAARVLARYRMAKPVQ